MRTLRWIMLSVAVAVLFGAAANAAPGVHLSLAGDQNGNTATCESPTRSPSESPPTLSNEPSSEPCPSPSESPSQSPSPSPSPSSPPGTLTCPPPPPVTTPGTVHGLDNAIAHVDANCQAHPNQGLVNALNHLIANLAKHQAHAAGKLTGLAGHGHGGSQNSAHGNGGTAPSHHNQGKKS